MRYCLSPEAHRLSFNGPSRHHKLCCCRHNQLRDLACAIVNEENDLTLKSRVKRRDAAMLLSETVSVIL